MKEKNGLEGKEKVDITGGIVNSCEAELHVYRSEKNTGKTVIICPGGGYTQLAMKHEGEMFARWLNKRGITAIVLKYRMPNQHASIPFSDVKRAVRWVRSRAEEWGIHSDEIGVAGFSAGGHLASTLATHFDSGNTKAMDRLERFSCRPDFVLLFYPVISMKTNLTHNGSRNALLGKNPTSEIIGKYSNELQISANTPPTFMVHCDDDAVVPALNSVVFYQGLKKYNVPAVLYIFPKGGHGWGLYDTFEYYSCWTSLLEKWLKGV